MPDSLKRFLAFNRAIRNVRLHRVLKYALINFGSQQCTADFEKSSDVRFGTTEDGIIR